MVVMHQDGLADMVGQIPVAGKHVADYCMVGGVMLVFDGDDQFGGLILSGELLFVIGEFLHHDGDAAVVEQAESIGILTGNTV